MVRESAMKKTERRCPKCAKPIEAYMSFCRQHWFEIPTALRVKITTAIAANNFFEKSRGIKAALDFFKEKADETFCERGGT